MECEQVKYCWITYEYAVTLAINLILNTKYTY